MVSDPCKRDKSLFSFILFSALTVAVLGRTKFAYRVPRNSVVEGRKEGRGRGKEKQGLSPAQSFPILGKGKEKKKKYSVQLKKNKSWPDPLVGKVSMDKAVLEGGLDA